ncbi:NAD(P)-dependent dehydrogenase (short-subunit alcohol dehydrogenase family) [Cricetibacter osteomyelitidis]|uniref:NAD(P)-dependent dehydrogenase (Short-subunit alcohol dehydrogenase family) n=1 Tax=Cricetibacter osteomyelitidis TaxID=1521931 RepID=A0A4R2T2Y9_9PAST|nr:SDR family oxidoreductase [Cricetibacter osteomyelitidis]TCP97317.1 NAD(P)-dependent dehydrogenase (short-subunit alcohol dehydrogenase family) [Cricetibacter osteomyelitidis]
MTTLTNQTAIVTGAASGIGLAIAVRLAELGANVIITGRNAETLNEAAKAHQNLTALAVDVGNTDGVKTLLGEVAHRFGRLDIIVNNAGMAPVTPIGEQTLEEFDRVFNINVRAVVDLTRQALPMLKASKGRIINISSAVANQPLPNMSVYSASKAALKTLTAVWAKELAKDGIRVNSVAVGPIETPIYEKTDLTPEQAQAHKDRVTALIPLGYFGQPKDIADVVAFLSGEQSAYITGADIAVDGGFGI